MSLTVSVEGLSGGTMSQHAGIQAAIDDVQAAGGGSVVFPGDATTYYNIGAQLTVTSSNVSLVAPERARLRILSSATVALAVGNIQTGINLSQGNTLASNAGPGALTITLSNGKGANIVAGSMVVLKSNAVIPDHHGDVKANRAEFVRVRSKSADTLNLDRPLRYVYNTADGAEVCNVTWIENFAIDGLGFDGNAQTPCSIALQLSWCYKPQVRRVAAKDLQQRLLRLQGCYQALVDDLSQENGLSKGFLGEAADHYSYMLVEGSMNEGLIAQNLRADRVRHAYTTVANFTTNAAETWKSPTQTDIQFSAPTGFNIGPGVASNMRGAGWDTHEVGVDGVFHDLQTLGSLSVGLQNRCVRTRIYNFFARDCIGAAIQLGADSQDTTIESWDFQNCNLGTDEATGTDWTKRSPIQDNSARSFLGRPAPNEVDNSNFELWERGSSFSVDGGTANRWKLTKGTGADVTVSRQTHVAGTGGQLVGRNYLRFQRTITGSSGSKLSQYLSPDDVRHLSGQRVVVSFRARSNVNGTDLRVWIEQHFGTGGDGDVKSAEHTRELDMNFRRYSIVIDVPSIATKTVGSNEDSYSILVFELPTSEGTCLFDVDAVKLEIGRTPTTYVAEPLAVTKDRCGRWYEKSYSDTENPGSGSTVGNVVIAADMSGGASANLYRRTVHMTTRKGRLPTITIYAQHSGAINKVRNVMASADRDATVFIGGYQSFHAGLATSGGAASQDVIQFSWVASVPDFE